MIAETLRYQASSAPTTSQLHRTDFPASMVKRPASMGNVGTMHRHCCIL
jgi:hypothetical protein